MSAEIVITVVAGAVILVVVAGVTYYCGQKFCRWLKKSSAGRKVRDWLKKRRTNFTICFSNETTEEDIDS